MKIELNIIVRIFQAGFVTYSCQLLWRTNANCHTAVSSTQSNLPHIFEDALDVGSTVASEWNISVLRRLSGQVNLHVQNFHQ